MGQTGNPSSSLFQREPVAVTAAADAIVKAVAALGFAFHWFIWSPEQLGAVLGLDTVVVAFIFLLFVRNTVSPSANGNVTVTP